MHDSRHQVSQPFTAPSLDRAPGAHSWSVRREVWLRVGACALVSLTAVSCAHTQAKTVVELPPLDMPSAPPRVVEANEPQPPAVIALPEDTPPTIRTRPAPAPRAEAPRPPEPPKAEASPEPPKAEEPKPAPTTLQTAPTQREAEMERRVRGLIARATADLGRVDYQALNVDARNQYDTARRFATQADDALKAHNVVFANNLADKAAALAAQLAGR